jgi:hypothetical protein
MERDHVPMPRWSVFERKAQVTLDGAHLLDVANESRPVALTASTPAVQRSLTMLAARYVRRAERRGIEKREATR